MEGLRFLGDWRNLLLGALIVLAMNLRPGGLLDAHSSAALRRWRDPAAWRHLLDQVKSGTVLAGALAAVRERIARWRGAFGA